MSQVGNNIYPNTTFPDSIQTLPTFENLSSADESNYIDYLRAILNGNLSEANYYLSLINPNTIITASALNILSDTVGAIQAVYSDSSIFSNVIDEKQSEWEEIIARFSYVGDWVSPIIYDSSVAYTVGDIVIYNNKTWKCKVNTTAGNIPQEGIYWTQFYYKNSMVSYTDSTTNRKALYVALQDINIDTNPYDSYISNSPQWFRLTLIGIVGDNGDGFSFRGAWDSTVSYTLGDLVTYNASCYSSKVNSNLNHTPSDNSQYWQLEFSIDTRQIPVQSTMPTSQAIGDLWFEIITIE